MKQKQIAPKDIQHVNALLVEVEKFIKEEGIDFTLQSELIISELLLINKKWSRKVLNKSLTNLRVENKKFTYKELKREYEVVLGSIKKGGKQSMVFTIPVNYELPEEFILDSVQIKKIVSKEAHKRTIENIKSTFWYKRGKIDIGILRVPKVYLLEFTIYEETTNLGYEKFRSVLLLLKGILEFSHSKEQWVFNPFDNQKLHLSTIPHPPFVLVKGLEKNMMSDYGVIGYNDVPMEVKDVKIFDGRMKLSKDLLALFAKTSKNTYVQLLQSCFMLYNMGKDTSYPERSFMYFWNVLEKLTLSESFRGKTEEVVRRSQIFVNKEKVKLYPYNYKNLSVVRNNLVHRGESNVTHIDVGLTRDLLEWGLTYLVTNINTISSIEQLEQFYLLNGKSKKYLVSAKKLIDVLLKTDN